MEFKVNDKALSLLDTMTIESNVTEIIGWAQDVQEKYSAIIVTDETAMTAKKIRADINRAKKAINDERIRIKKRYLAPYQEWEERIKVATSVLDDTADKLDRQLKAMEEQRKAEKRNELIRTYEESIGNAKDYIAFTDLEDTKWMNATVKLETAKQELADTCVAWAKCIDDFEHAIKDEPETVKLALRREMKQTHSTMAVFNLLHEMQKAKEQEKKEQEEKTCSEPKEDQKPVQTVMENVGSVKEDEPRFPVRLEMWLYKEQAVAIRELLNEWKAPYTLLDN